MKQLLFSIPLFVLFSAVFLTGCGTSQKQKTNAYFDPYYYWEEQGFSPKTKVCPNCGASDATPIIYGVPDEELRAQIKKGAVIMGRGKMTKDSPFFCCNKCYTSY